MQALTWSYTTLLHRSYDVLSLYRCSFNGKQCGAGDFEEIYTNGGLCYVFNGNPNDVASSSQAGKN